MSIAKFDSGNNISLATASPLTVVIPQYEDDDIIVVTASVWTPNTGSVIDEIPTPAGYTKEAFVQFPTGAERGEIAFFWRRATARYFSTQNLTMSFGANWDTGTDMVFAARAYNFSDCVDTGDPWDEIVFSTLYTAANGNLPAVTVNDPGRVVAQFYVATDDVSPSTPSGWTLYSVQQFGTGTDAAAGLFYKSDQSASTSADATTVGAPAYGGYVYIGASFRPADPPANDDRASATAISTASGSTAGTTKGASLEGGEYTPPGGTQSYIASVWYEFDPPATGKYKFRVEYDANDFPDQSHGISLIAYEGGSTPSQATAIMGEPYGTIDGEDPEMTLSCVSTDTYLLAVYSRQENGGLHERGADFTLVWEDITTLAPANDDFANATELFNKDIVFHNLTNATMEVDDPFTFIKEESWWSNGDDFPDYSPGGRSVFYKFDADATTTVSVGILDSYWGYCSVWIWDGTGVTDVADLATATVVLAEPEMYFNASFSVTAGTTYYIWISSTYNGESDIFDYFFIRWNDGTVPANDDFADAVVLEPGDWNWGTTANATWETGEQDGLYITASCPTVWYKVYPDISADIDIDVRKVVSENQNDGISINIWQPFERVEL